MSFEESRSEHSRSRHVRSLTDGVAPPARRETERHPRAVDGPACSPPELPTSSGGSSYQRASTVASPRLSSRRWPISRLLVTRNVRRPTETSRPLAIRQPRWASDCACHSRPCGEQAILATTSRLHASGTRTVTMPATRLRFRLERGLTYVGGTTQAETVTALGETSSHHRQRVFPIFHAVFCSVASIFVFRVWPNLRIGRHVRTQTAQGPTG